MLKSSEMLAWYMRDFDTVELNRLFYRLPTRKAFKGWRNAARLARKVAGREPNP